ncbi:MAG: hypothetical protein P8Z30_07855 [Acidobacteriota bacterium]
MRMPDWRRRLVLLLAGFSCLLFFSPYLKANEYTKTLHYRVRLFTGGTFTMEVRTGDIYITGWDDPHVEIEADKVVYAKSKKQAEHRFKRIGISLEGRDKAVHLRTLYPPRRLWRPFRGESHLTVNFHIHMPYDCNLVLKVVDGDVRVTGLTGHEKLMVNYGDVEVDIPSLYHLRSVRAKTWLGNVQSNLNGPQDSAGFNRKVLYWNPKGTQDIWLKVHMGGIYVFRGEGGYIAE